MNSLVRSARTGCLLVLIAAFGAGAPAQEVQDDSNVPDGLEVQTRGPVHEAYAQPNDPKPGPGQLVPKEPPPPVPEEAPEVRPEGRNIGWIPGYWSWDIEREDFLWVSGTYREQPVGRRWMPGHWVRADDGWRWVAGLWASAQQDEVPLTPEPPEPLNNEPNLPAPDDDSAWLPGYWHYNQSRFVWRPGYWAPQYAGRVWVTPRYQWTPNGHLFCDGYWDYPYEDRGLLFAPVYFNRPLWQTAGWSYRPWYAVNVGLFYNHCFWRSGSSHFFFGNYYDRGCWGFGYRPWFYGQRWDSCFAHHRWSNHRGDHDWHDRQRRNFEDRRDGRGDRPPRSLAEQRDRLGGKNVASVKNAQVVAPVTQIKNVNKNVNLVKNTPAQTQAIKQQTIRNQELVDLRNRAAGAKNKDTTPGNGVRNVANKSFKLPALADRNDGGLREDNPMDRPLNNGGGKKGPVVLNKPKDVDGPGAGPKIGGNQRFETPNKPFTVGKPKDVDGPGAGPKIGGNQKFETPNKPFTIGKPKDFDGPGAGPKIGGNQKFETPLRPRDDGPGPNKPFTVGKPKDFDGPGAGPKIGGNQKFETPKIRGNDSAPLPRVFETPRKVEMPRVIDSSPPLRNVTPNGPRIPSGPSGNSNPGRLESAPSFVPRRIESPAPRINTTPAPRINVPSPAPRFSAPPSAPRSNPAPRSASRSSAAPSRSAPSRGRR